MAATPTVIVQAAKKLPITCIGQINYDALMGIGLLAGSPIKPEVEERIRAHLAACASFLKTASGSFNRDAF